MAATGTAPQAALLATGRQFRAPALWGLIRNDIWPTAILTISFARWAIRLILALQTIMCEMSESCWTSVRAKMKIKRQGQKQKSKAADKCHSERSEES